MKPFLAALFVLGLVAAANKPEPASPPVKVTPAVKAAKPAPTIEVGCFCRLQGDCLCNPDKINPTTEVTVTPVQAKDSPAPRAVPTEAKSPSRPAAGRHELRTFPVYGRFGRQIGQERRWVWVPQRQAAPTYRQPAYYCPPNGGS